MIIGVNGKIGSGKDTVGKIIQWLTKQEPDGQYIGFQTYDDVTLERNSSFKIKKFAGKLKTIASLLTGIPIEMFENQQFKQKHMGLQWKMTYREFLQKLGTEAMRDGLHTNVWVNALFADYKSKRELLQADGTWIESDTGEVDFAVSIKYPKWIITDMRFPNEMEAVEEKEGITIRVVRYPKTVEQSRGPENVETIPFDPTNQKHMDLWKGDSSRLHPSETALDDAKFDYEIINDGTIEDLIEKVRALLIKENII
jgi:hypothetical protein